MCEINPKHKAFFRLEAFTSNPNITEKEFKLEIAKKILEIEMILNEDMRYRFHIHEQL